MVQVSGDGANQSLLKSARALYADLARELVIMIEKIKADRTSDESKGLAEALKAHRKALQTVLEYELTFMKSTDEAQTSNDLDLDAARTEVFGRLDRITAAQSDQNTD